MQPHLFYCLIVKHYCISCSAVCRHTFASVVLHLPSRTYTWQACCNTQLRPCCRICCQLHNVHAGFISADTIFVYMLLQVFFRACIMPFSFSISSFWMVYTCLCRWPCLQLLGLWQIREKLEGPANQGGQERQASYDCSSRIWRSGCPHTTRAIPEPSRPSVRPHRQQHFDQLWQNLQLLSSPRIPFVRL